MHVAVHNVKAWRSIASWLRTVALANVPNVRTSHGLHEWHEWHEWRTESRGVPCHSENEAPHDGTREKDRFGCIGQHEAQSRVCRKIPLCGATDGVGESEVSGGELGIVSPECD